jgi:hypothetical protein
VLPFSALAVILILARTRMLWGEHDERAVTGPVVVLDEGWDASLVMTMKLTEAPIAALVLSVNEDDERSRVAVAVAGRQVLVVAQGRACLCGRARG